MNNYRIPKLISLAVLILGPPLALAFWLGISSCDPVNPGDSKPVQILPEIQYYSFHKDCIDAAQTYAPLRVDVDVRDESGAPYYDERIYNWGGYNLINTRVPNNGKFKIFLKVYGRCHDCCSARWFPDGQPLFSGGKVHDESADGSLDIHAISLLFEGCKKCERS